MERKSFVDKIKNFIATQTAIVLILVITIAVAAIKPSFISATNLFNIMRQMAITSFSCYGILIVMSTGNMDLSVGSNVAFAVCVAGALFKYMGVTSPFVLVPAIFITTTVVAWLNAFIYTKFRLPATFIVTLATNMAWRGLAYVISKAATIAATTMPMGVRWLGQGNIPGTKMPVSFLFVVAACIVVDILLRKTVLGRNFFFMGDNQTAAKLAGIDTDKVIIKAFLIEGFLAGFSALVTIGRISACSPGTASMLGMDCIAGAVIGGAAFSGGKGNIWGAFAGTLLMTVINSALNFFGAPSYIQDVCVGVILLFAVWLDTTRGRNAEKARRLAQAKADKENNA